MQKKAERLAAARRLENVYRPNEMKRERERHLIQHAIILLKNNDTDDAVAYELGILAIQEHLASRDTRRDVLERACTLLTASPSQ